jgi:uncharacterized protein YutE (UPF0331/DUF86 family)
MVDRLHDRGVISPGTASALSSAVGLRNMVARGYGGVDVSKIYAAATAGVRDLDAFAREVAARVRVRTAG